MSRGNVTSKDVYDQHTVGMAVLAIAAVCCRPIDPAALGTDEGGGSDGADGTDGADGADGAGGADEETGNRLHGAQRLLVASVANKLQVIAHVANLLNEAHSLPVQLVSPLLFDGPAIQRTFLDMLRATGDGAGELPIARGGMSMSFDRPNAAAAGGVCVDAPRLQEGHARLMALWDFVVAA
jgi:hypothetical protein